MAGVEVRARAGSVQPNLAKIGDQRGSSAEVLGCLRPSLARQHSTRSARELSSERAHDQGTTSVLVSSGP